MYDNAISSLTRTQDTLQAREYEQEMGCYQEFADDEV